MWNYLVTRRALSCNVNTHSRRRSRRHRSRVGAAAVEFAVCLPVLVAVVLGSIEASNLIHVQHALQAAAYEAARTAGKDSTVLPAQIESVAKAVLEVYKVDEGHVDVTPDITTVSTGGQVTVTVSASIADNRVILGWAPKWLLGDSDLSAQCTVVKG